MHALKWAKQWPTRFDLQNLTAGSSKDLDLHAHTIQRVCGQYSESRQAKNKARLAWRGKKSLGWVPFSQGHVKYVNGAFCFRGRMYRAWISRDMKDGQTFGSGSFSQDSQGNWYINLLTEVGMLVSAGKSVVGIDLGLKDLATLSNGEKIENPRWFRTMEDRIAMAQRAHKKGHVKKLNAMVKARRNDFLHQLSTRLVREHGAIFVGNVNAAQLSKTSMAKSVLDAGWSMLRTQLRYKAIRHAVVFDEVNEAFSTQACSDCGLIGGPKGLQGLAIRQWTCECGAIHDRDVNAARNIARRGLATLAEGASHE